MGRTSRKATQPPDAAGRFAYDKLERVIHERARLGIMTSLVSRATSGVSGGIERAMIHADSRAMAALKR